jgi:hypothetical protein
MTMLRVGYSDSAEGHRWSLCGRLAGPWVEEFRSYWRQALNRTPRCRVVVDLKEVTFIDEAGEKLLGERLSAGAEFIAGGVENQHLLESLKSNGEPAPAARSRGSKYTTP